MKEDLVVGGFGGGGAGSLMRTSVSSAKVALEDWPAWAAVRKVLVDSCNFFYLL